MKKTTILLALAISTLACSKQHKLTEFEYPDKIDTSDHPIDPQEKRTYTIMGDGVSADNLFDAARMNDFSKIEANHYQVQINPENSPINMSPWYAFRIYAEEEQDVKVTINYGKGRHRYWPKLSTDGKTWTPMDSTLFSSGVDSLTFTMNLSISPDTLWVAAQEIISSSDMKAWTSSLNSDKIEHSVIGKTRLGRDLLHMDITNDSKEDKDIVVVLSRQHPPEVTGNLAMMAFLEEIISDTKLSNQFLDQYRLLVYPMLNPDGVDLGHWRHNEGGIDLNRDWAYYRQPEVKQVCEDIIAKVNETQAEVKLGLDFHSTWSDIYYIYEDTVQSSIQGFSREWIGNIFERVPEDQGRISPFAVTSPVSKNWFYSQFGAEGITYEIGDQTPRDLIKEKGQVGAQEMMKLLLNKY
ncbi:M14-type cytosolic carboxypeptidase [Roseivirga pacifica]|uniref:M14 family metallopeptidase n=1 Tax=Roseivirga pacifica TaxID=1267423 RepID=UPI003BAB0FC5